MKLIAINIGVASIGLGFASPFLAVLLVSAEDATARQGLIYNWFYGIPAEVLAITPLQDGSAFFAAIGLFVIQYFLLFIAILGGAVVLRWTFSSNLPSVIAHMLHPRKGVVRRRWRVGREVSAETVERLAECGHIFVITVYERNLPAQIIVTREVWNEAVREMQKVDADAKAAFQRAMTEIDSLR